MGITDELKKLDELHREGTLTDEEFTRAKSRILEVPPIVTAPTMIAGSTLPVPLIEVQLADIRLQNELARIDREWENDRRRYELVGRRGQKFVPSAGGGIATAVVGGISGLLWTAATLWMMGPLVASGFDSPLVIRTLRILPVLGVVWIIYAMTRGIYYCVVACNHETARREFQKRRENALKNSA